MSCGRAPGSGLADQEPGWHPCAEWWLRRAPDPSLLRAQTERTRRRGRCDARHEPSSLQGLFNSPQVVGEALKGAELVAECLSQQGTPPTRRQAAPADIIQAVTLGSQAWSPSAKLSSNSPVGHIQPVPGTRPAMATGSSCRRHLHRRLHARLRRRPATGAVRRLPSRRHPLNSWALVLATRCAPWRVPTRPRGGEGDRGDGGSWPHPRGASPAHSSQEHGVIMRTSSRASLGCDLPHPAVRPLPQQSARARIHDNALICGLEDRIGDRGDLSRAERISIPEGESCHRVRLSSMPRRSTSRPTQGAGGDVQPRCGRAVRAVALSYQFFHVPGFIIMRC